jgi:hypothetical protein
MRYDLATAFPDKIFPAAGFPWRHPVPVRRRPRQGIAMQIRQPGETPAGNQREITEKLAKNFIASN